MCGLAGLFVNAPGDRGELRSAVESMAQALAHRGPDDSDTWVHPDLGLALGFRRLAILDLSVTGRQPMRSPSGRFTLVFNGEIYNHADLSRKLPSISYRGTSDTEILLHAFDHWGVEATLPRLIGMFAIAVWDEKTRELLLIRDRMGIKPLYVASTAQGVAFGSELGALLHAPGLDRTLDGTAIRTFLRYLYFPAPFTPLRQVRKVRPGHFIRVRLPPPAGEVPSQECWWSLDDVRRSGQSDRRGAHPSKHLEAHVSEFEELLRDAVGLRMVADVPVGAFLSGGIDSSLVVAMMQAQSSQPVRSFTIAFDAAEHDESRFAKAVAEYLGTDHTELLVTGRDALATIPSLPDVFDEPVADPSQIPTLLVSELARQHVTVALSGDGGDELFAGYSRHAVGMRTIRTLRNVPQPVRSLAARAIAAVPGRAWSRLDRRGFGPLGSMRLAGSKAGKLGRMLASPSERDMYLQLLTTTNRSDRLLPGEFDVTDPVDSQLSMRPAHLTLSDMLLCDQTFYLPDDLLHKVDRASMAVGLEVRVPLLDHRIVEFSWSLPESVKLADGRGKWLLRALLNRHLPRHLVDRPKTGFTVPLAMWLAGPLRPWAEDLLFGSASCHEPLLDRAEIARTWKAFLGGATQEAPGLWAILSLEAWRSRWGVRSLDLAA